ncbi:MarR family winged helix-turn-helix transcriptional regulator [Neotabrizicola shimadae]|uniref:MarR family transcriptional regulator n=1 Tax=Neotabrizicola shimadae TaxID=2807096 RepID=A0A8G0ZRS3_9RHOB|nr:MarR family transcriptional regulator [Neotabrizicola shimadae]QYZ70231.1 MarR family transcriptional regulator [Neotabrizicola shimadae]
MAMTPPDMICFALYSAAHAVQQAYKPLLDEIGLTYPQYLVMTVLWAEDGQTVGAIGRQVLLESSTLTPLLKRLETQGLVERSRDIKDERQVRISLTDAGRALAIRAAHVPACFFDLAGLPLEDLVALRDRVIALRDRLRQGAPA